MSVYGAGQATVIWLALPFDHTAGISLTCADSTLTGSFKIGSSETYRLRAMEPDRIVLDTENRNIGQAAVVTIPTGSSATVTMFYWVTDVQQLSADKGVRRVTLVPDAARNASQYYKTVHLTRKPSVTPNLGLTVMPDVLAPSHSMKYGVQTLGTGGHRIGLARVTLSREPAPYAARTSDYNVNSDTSPEYMVHASPYPSAGFNSRTGFYMYCTLVDMDEPTARVPGPRVDGTNDTVWPSVWDLAQKLGSILGDNVSTQDVVDISITSVLTFGVLKDADDAGWMPYIADSTKKTRMLSMEDNDGTHWALMDISRETNSYIIEQVKTLAPSTGGAGPGDNVEFTDVYGHSVGSIPYWQAYTAGWTLSMMVDMSNITTVIENETLGVSIMIPEGHLPYLGDAWDQYLATERAYDREMLSISIEQSRAEAMVNAAQTISGAGIAAASGPAGPVAALVTGAVSIGATAAAEAISERALKDTQAAKENMIRAQPATVYSPGYGMSYSQNVPRDVSHAIRTMAPANRTQTVKDNYVAWNGYPADEYAVLQGTLSGYYRGEVLGMHGMLQGVKLPPREPDGGRDMMELLKAQFRAGIRFINEPFDM